MNKNPDKLLPYSLGQLDKKDKKEFEKELDLNSALEKELQEMQILLEAIALADTPVKPSEKLKQSLIASMNAQTPFHGYVDRFMRLFDLGRTEVEALFRKIVNQPDDIFIPCGIPKTSLFYFDGGPQVAHTTCGLIRVKANSIFPAHQHQGKEWVLVLQGTATDQSGNVYFPGDTVFSDETVSHSLRTGKREDLIFAVVLEKPNKWLISQIILDYLFPGRRFKK